MTFEEYYPYLIAGSYGLLGGIIRVIIPFLNKIYAKKKIEWRIWGMLILMKGIIGFFIGMIFPSSYVAAALSGFMGLDILKGVYNSLKIDKVIEVDSQV